ncbi:TonB-dependent receptor [Pseudoteredinibacter isoporae]|uniref:TonB-dependent receptor n=1 Tax=Pseudoteredinibacter isoporae TaxID=570281 RepID=UPI003106547A
MIATRRTVATPIKTAIPRIASFTRHSLYLALSAAMLASPAKANDSQPEHHIELEEIVVLARKVEENSQSVPISITALSADFIKQAGINNVADTLSFTPGATLFSSSPLEQQYSIRGVSSGSEGAASESSVLVMQDGEVLARDFMRSAAYFDVAQIEVLRGPQGISYGKNATGGLVHILSHRPHNELEAELGLGLGTYNARELEGFINGPVSEEVSARLSFSHTERDGFTEDLVSDEDLDHWKSTGLRAQFLYQNDDLDILLRAHWMDEEGGQTPRKNFDVNAPYSSPLGTSYTELSSDPWSVSNSQHLDFGTTRTIQGLNIELSKQFDWLTLTSITTYREAEAKMIRDGFGTPDDLFFSTSLDDADTFSQEIRLDNSASDDSIRWLAGLYLSKDQHHRIEDRTLAASPIAGGMFETLDYIDQESENVGLGLFTEIKIDLSERSTLSLGARYSVDEKDFTLMHRSSGALSFAFLDEPGPLIANADEQWKATTASASLSYDLNDNAMLYTKVSTGYKGGGFNGEATTRNSAITPFDEENVVNLELGVKSELWNNRLRLNIAAFHLDYTDIQVEAFPDGAAAPIIDNAGEARIQGVELDTQLALTENLRLIAGLALYDHEYKEYVKDDVDLQGNNIANVPDWTFNLTALYEHDLSSGGALQARLDYNTRSDIFDDPENWDTNDGGQNGLRERVDHLNARLAWISSDDHWEVDVWVKNILDEAEVMNVGPQFFLSQRPVVYGAPRRAGVSLRFRL